MVRTLVAVLVCCGIALASAPDLAGCSSAIDRGDFASAVRDAQAFVRLHPASAAARIVLARAYMGLNNGSEALAQLREAIRREPDNIEALYYLAKLAGILSQMEFGEVGRIDPESARMHQIRAEALAAQGKVSSAETEYRTALDKLPGSVSILIALGDLKRLDRKYDEALAWYGKVLEKEPDNYDALYGTGACYLYSRSPEEALPLFRRALKGDPTSMAAKMAVGESLLMTGDAAHALPLLEEAGKADPNLRRLQFLLGRAYRELGRTEESRRAFERVRELTQPGEADPVATEDQ